MAGKRSEGVYPRVRKRDGVTVYDACWNIGGRKYWKKGLPSKAEAVRHRREALSKADRGEHVSPSKATLSAYLEKWSQGQHATCRRYLKKHVIDEPFAQAPLQKLTATDVRAHYAWLREEQGLAANTVRLVHVFLKQALTVAEEDGLVVKNVANQVRSRGRGLPDREEPDVPEPWSVDEVRRFLRAAESDRLHALWRLYATTGMRRNEALQLRWSDVDLDRGTVVIRRQTKNKQSRRTIDLDPTTVSVLRAWRKAQAEEWLALGGGRPEQVFTHESGRVTSPKHVFLGFNALRRRPVWTGDASVSTTCGTRGRRSLWRTGCR